MYNSLEELCRYGVITEVVVDVGEEETSVPVVSHMTTIVNSGNQVFQGIPWCVFVLVQVNTQKILWYLMTN